MKLVLLSHHDRYPYVFVGCDRIYDSIEKLTFEAFILVDFLDFTTLKVRNFLNMAIFPVAFAIVKIGIREG